MASTLGLGHKTFLCTSLPICCAHLSWVSELWKETLHQMAGSGPLGSREPASLGLKGKEAFQQHRITLTPYFPFGNISWVILS